MSAADEKAALIEVFVDWSNRRLTAENVRKSNDETLAEAILAAGFHRAEAEVEPVTEETAKLDALHFPSEVWDDWRQAILRNFPNIDIFRLPDSEPCIRSWGISPKD